MWKKAIVAVLVLTIAAAVVVAVIDNLPSASAADQPVAEATAVPAAAANRFGAGGQAAGQHGQDNQASGAAVQQQLNQSVDNVGEAWTATVTVVELGDVGMTATLEDGSPVYVELGTVILLAGAGHAHTGRCRDRGWFLQRRPVPRGVDHQG